MQVQYEHTLSPTLTYCRPTVGSLYNTCLGDASVLLLFITDLGHDVFNVLVQAQDRAGHSMLYSTIQKPVLNHSEYTSKVTRSVVECLNL